MPFDRFDLFGSLALAFLFATSGAFDSMSVTPFPLRFGLWVAVVCPIWMGTGALVRYTLIRMKDGDEILTYVVAAMAAAVTSLLATIYIKTLWHFIFDVTLQYGELFLSIGSINVVMSFAIMTIRRQARTPKKTTNLAPVLTPVQNQLTSKIPAKLGDQIVSLHAQDHYVQVFTAKGECLVLMRFDDAVGAMPPDVGFWAHRSHWIDISSTHKILRADGRVYAEMRDGRLVPVSRGKIRRLAQLLSPDTE